jgi:hypothetical protein
MVSSSISSFCRWWIYWVSSKVIPSISPYTALWFRLNVVRPVGGNRVVLRSSSRFTTFVSQGIMSFRPYYILISTLTAYWTEKKNCNYRRDLQCNFHNYSLAFGPILVSF